jgi:hypothetical protein
LLNGGHLSTKKGGVKSSNPLNPVGSGPVSAVTKRDAARVFRYLRSMENHTPVFWGMTVLAADKHSPLRWEARCPVCDITRLMTAVEGAKLHAKKEPIACDKCGTKLLVPATVP